MKLPLKTLLVDDNREHLEYLESLLLQHPQIVNPKIDLADKAITAATLVKMNEYQLSFLDYELDDGQYLTDLMRIVDRSRFGIIVYTSRHKKIEPHKTVEIAPNFFLYKRYDATTVKERLDEITDFVKMQVANVSEYYISDHDGINKVTNDEVYYIESSKNYVTFYCVGGRTCKTRITMEELETILNPDWFIRSHNQYIINLTKVVNIAKDKCLYFDMNNKKLVAHYSDGYRNALVQKGVLRKPI